jgi:hypothetical protein
VVATNLAIISVTYRWGNAGRNLKAIEDESAAYRSHITNWPQTPAYGILLLLRRNMW